MYNARHWIIEESKFAGVNLCPVKGLIEHQHIITQCIICIVGIYIEDSQT